MDPYAQCYGGHQFGHWAGQLGDGRAIVLGEVTPGGEGALSQEVQLKGAGKTPYSRRADGRAVLRSSLREFICSEAMHAMGVPTTRALSLVGTGDAVMRDMFYNGNGKWEPGAVTTRVAPTFVRFGSFQLPASRGDKALCKKFADFVVRRHYPQYWQEGLLKKPDYAGWFAEVCERTGVLFAKWQLVGFVHGVLNTDNMSILGVTIDYGPYGFLEAFDPNFTPNTTDMPGLRYCFKNQPEIGQWNLAQLANALAAAGLLSKGEAEAGLERYADALHEEYTAGMARKMGLREYDIKVSTPLMQNMYDCDADFTRTFRALRWVEAEGEGIPEGLRAELGPGMDEEKEKKWGEWVNMYREVLRAEGWDADERRAAMDASNPVYIPRNWLCQVAIEAAEAGDYSKVQELHEVLKRPYEEQEGMEFYAGVAPPDMAKRPGVVCLSCSS